MKTLLKEAQNVALPYIKQIKKDNIRELTTSIFAVDNPVQEEHAANLAKTCKELGIVPDDYLELLREDEVAAFYVLEAVNAAHRVFHAPELHLEAFFMNWLPSLCDMATEIESKNQIARPRP